MNKLAILAGITCALAQETWAQSLFQRPAAAPPSAPAGVAPAGPSMQPEQGGAAAAPAGSDQPVPPGAVSTTPAIAGPPAPVQTVSLFAVQAPPPPTFAENDLITIIISERSAVDLKQKLEADKNYEVAGGVAKFPDLLKLLELRAEAGNRDGIDDDTGLPQLELDYDNQYEGEGKYKDDRKTTARVTAVVREVKPNGTLLLEARKEIDNDGEVQTILLSGLCRTEDVTVDNTVQSNQIADLTLSLTTKGEVRRSTKKGLIPRALEALFNF